MVVQLDRESEDIRRDYDAALGVQVDTLDEAATLLIPLLHMRAFQRLSSLVRREVIEEVGGSKSLSEVCTRNQALLPRLPQRTCVRGEWFGTSGESIRIPAVPLR